MKDPTKHLDDSIIGELGVSYRLPETGKYVLQDDHLFFSKPVIEGLELLPVSNALKKYDWLLNKYFCETIRKPGGRNNPEDPDGYFVRVYKNQKIPYLCQTVLLLLSPNISQTPHNIIVLEEGASLSLITGCASGKAARNAKHISFSEVYVGKNASLTHNMMHKWNGQVQTESQSAAVVDEDGRFVCNHVVMRSAHKLISNPRTWLIGKNASAKYNTVILSDSQTEADLGGEIYLNAENTSAELIHRAVCAGGNIIQRGLLIGSAKCKAHVDCAGMVLNSEIPGNIESIPGLKSLHPEANMSHEASIGKISPSQVEYLRCRGIGEMDAISMIIRGFIDSGIQGLGSEIDEFINEIVSVAGHGEGKK